MKRVKSLQFRTVSMFLLVQLLSTVFVGSYSSAAVVNTEVESSQVLEGIIDNSGTHLDSANKEVVGEVAEDKEILNESSEEEKEVAKDRSILVEDSKEVIIEEDEIILEEDFKEVIVEENRDQVTSEENAEELPKESDEEAESAPPISTLSVHSTATNHRTVNYVATIYKGTNTIDTLPWGEAGYQQIGTTEKFIGTTVTVTKESANGAYGYIFIEGLGNGWVDLKALKVLDVVPMNYYDYITSEKYEVNSLPWGVAGFQKLGSTSQYLGHQLYIRYKTANGAYLYAELNGKMIGWIDAKAFGLSGNKFSAIISSGSYNVDSLPWGTPGYKTLSMTKDYVGMELEVSGSTQNGGYYLVEANGISIGWIDKRAIVPFVTKTVNYSNFITGVGYSIDSFPWGTPGFKKMGTTALYLGRNVNITRETADGRYVYINTEGIGQGWVDKNALGLKGTSGAVTIVDGSYSVDTLPFGTQGFSKIANTNAYIGSELEVKGTTNSGSYSLVYQNGKVLGWIDSRALKPMHYKTVNYNMEVSGNRYEIDSLPWGDYGFKKMGTTASYVGLTLNITKESSNGSYLYASHAGKGLGWIDKRAFGFKNLSYSYYITNGQYNLDTLPWGTIGSKQVSLTKSLIGKELEVIATTQDGGYLKVSENGKVLGWIDSKAGKRLNEKRVNYSAKISSPGNTIDSLPWGTPGFTRLGIAANHIGKQVIITKESVGGHYLFATELSGRVLGWIDKRAFSYQRTVFIDVGHGGSDPGASYFGVKEKDINLQVSNKLKAQLEAAGYRVIMSRTGDTYMDYSTERSIMANKSGADIFVSVHHNAMPGNSSVNGIETFYYAYEPGYPSKVNQTMHNNPDRLLKSAALANAIHSNLVKDTRAYDRTVKSTSFAVLRETALPAVLVELGFMSNQAELKKLTTDSYQSTLAKSMKNGIDSYFRTY